MPPASFIPSPQPPAPSPQPPAPSPQPPAPNPQPPRYDALLVVSFGGPEAPGDVLPFLQNVLRGRDVPRERMLEVAEHYGRFGGRSPLNDQNRALVAAIQRELAEHGPPLSVYWGNRNWHPLLADTLRQTARDGVRRALAFVTSAYSSYSGCRQYLEDIARARQEVGPAAPQVDKLRVFFNHPRFIEAQVDRTLDALRQIPAERRAETLILFTAHSIPLAMARTCRYEQQLRETCRLVIETIAERGMRNAEWSGDSEFPLPPSAFPLRHSLVYQSRSGPPHQPWLEPDVCEFLEGLGTGDWGLHEETPSPSPAPSPQSLVPSPHPLVPSPQSLVPSPQPPAPSSVVLVPVGFLSDHMEVVYDLDVEARGVCDRLGINMVRAETVGTHPRFVRMIRELILERTTDSAPRLALGPLGPAADTCPDDCCPPSPPL